MSYLRLSPVWMKIDTTFLTLQYRLFRLKLSHVWMEVIMSHSEISPAGVSQYVSF